MDAIIEFFLELLFAGLIEGLVDLYSKKYGHSKKIKKQYIEFFAAIEILILFVTFVVGGIICVETEWTSVLGKVMFRASIAVSAVQITLGVKRNRRRGYAL